MTFFMKSPKAQSQQQPAYTGIDLQTSSYGKTLTLAYGTTRIASNLIWYGDFKSTSHKTTQGGKGGGSVAGSTTYTYKTSVAFGLCYGPIVGIGKVYNGKAVVTFASTGLSLFTGSIPQAPWGYLTSAHPTQAVGYNGFAYVAKAGFNLGSSNALPNLTFEAQSLFSDSVNGTDADPSLVIADIMTNPRAGANFPAARIGDLSTYQDYTLAAGLLLSFSLQSQTQASSVLADIATATNSEYVWSEGLLNLVPFGDETITGNGHTYTPPAAPEYDLTDDDFIPQSDTDPVTLSRKRPSDAINSLLLEYENRTADYATDVVEAKDQAAIDRYGLLQQTATSTHLFADPAAAKASVQLQLQRQAIRNVYTFTTDERYVLLDPMDIITLTDSALGLDRQWVRIIDITENADRTLTFTAEEYLGGTGSAATYSFASGAGYTTNHNEDPGDANTPAIFDAPVQIATTSGLEVWMAVSGGDTWGGCDVYISSDDETYKLAGQVLGPARQGVLTAGLSIGSDPDVSHTLSVDLSQSQGELLSGTQNDADLGNTLCYVDGELIAFETADLTGPSQYDLTYLRRGMYGTANVSHLSGSQFARLDDGIFHYSYDKAQIGQTIYVKLTSFNIYQGGEQTLDQVSPYTYTIKGPPAPSQVTDFLVAQNGNSVNFTWTQIDDYALKGYDIGYALEGETDWHEFTLLTEASKGTEMTNAAVPAGTWTFGIRARDIADQLSPLSTFDLVVVNNNDTTTVQVQEPDWNGSLVGFVRHWSGVLVPDSTTLANATSDFTIFDNFVTDPVSTASYTTPTFDIGFVNSLRIHSAYELTPGPGESGLPSATTQLDAWTDGADPGTYVDWTVGTVPVRYLNMKINYDPVAGSVGYLTDFTYTVDRSPLIEQVESTVIPAGGATFTFPQPFHDVPYVQATPVSATPLFAAASSVTTTDCVIHVWDASGADVGGTVTVIAKGI